MTDSDRRSDRRVAGPFGTGPLFVVASHVYAVVVVTVAMIVTTLPVAAAVALLATPAGLPLVVLTSLLIGPAAVAAFTAVRRLRNGADESALRSYIRSLRHDGVQALLVWWPFVIVVAVIATNLTTLDRSVGPDVAPALRLVLLVLALGAGVIATTALLIVSAFRFRTRDTLRLAVFLIGASARSSLAIGALIVVTTALLAATSVFVLPFISGLFVYLVVVAGAPAVSLVRSRFTETGSGSGSGDS